MRKQPETQFTFGPVPRRVVFEGRFGYYPSRSAAKAERSLH